MQSISYVQIHRPTYQLGSVGDGPESRVEYLCYFPDGRPSTEEPTHFSLQGRLGHDQGLIRIQIPFHDLIQGLELIPLVEHLLDGHGDRVLRRPIDEVLLQP